MNASPFQLIQRFLELTHLESGWFDGDGTPFNPNDLSLLKIFLFQHLEQPQLLPYIYPLYENSISCEWNIGSWEVSLEVAFPSHQGQFHALNIQTNAVQTLTMDLQVEESGELLKSTLLGYTTELPESELA